MSRTVTCTGCESEIPRNLAEPGGLCPTCWEERQTEQREIEMMQRTTWVDDPAEGTYGDR